MKKNIMILILAISFSINFLISQTQEQAPHANPTIVQLSRSFSKDIFDQDGVPYMRPLVEALNATSNARFFNSAFVPQKVDKPYFKVSINGMMGIVREDMKTYKPIIPAEPFDFLKMSGYLTGSKFDTAGLMHYFFKTIVYDGINASPSDTKYYIATPNEAATILGNKITKLSLIDTVLGNLAQRRVDSVNLFLKALGQKPLSPQLSDSVVSTLKKVPGFFTLPQGADISRLIAGVPQFEIGSWMGTELLIRFVPKVDMGTNIGKFSFYGLGFKHSISQYFDKPFCDLAIQSVYQYTTLNNSNSETNSELTSNATILNINIHASKKIEDWFDVFCGISYEKLKISSVFKYFLSYEAQLQSGLLFNDPRWYLDPKDPNYIKSPALMVPKQNPKPSPGYPGDLEPQTSQLDLTSTNYKFILGIKRDISNFTIFADYSFSNFNIFSGGIQYKF